MLTCFNRKFRRCYCDNSNFDISVGGGIGGGGGGGFPNARIDRDTVGVLVRKKFESPFTTSSTNKYICYSQYCC